ncbi:MAG: AAA family ATPase [Candidatus Binataceae bacterium]
MYYQHFGLTAPPFQFTPSPKLLYMSKAHREALAALEWGLLHEPSGFTLLVGETGSGKTTLVCALLMRNYDLVRTAYVANPKLGFDEMLSVIMRQLGIESGPGRLQTIDAFNFYLGRLKEGARVVVIVDEAQGLSDEALEELRLFSNAGQREEKQLHFVLVGQPELMRRLKSPALRQLNDRVGARAMLNPLEREEAFAYVDYRLTAHEGSALQIFQRNALEYLIDHSGGIPRRINVLCHNAMLLAYSSGARKIELTAARAAVTEYEDLFATARKFKPSRATARSAGRYGRIWLGGAAVVAVAVAAAGAASLWSASGSHPDEPLTRMSMDASSASAGADSAEIWNKANAAVGSISALSAKVPAAHSSSPIAVGAGNAKSASANTATARPSSAADVARVDATAVSPADPPARGGPATTPRAMEAAPSIADAASLNDPADGGHGKRKIRVRYGDTMVEIAIRYLGGQGQLNSLIDANPQLANINQIYPGQVIYLPARNTSARQE